MNKDDEYCENAAECERMARITRDKGVASSAFRPEGASGQGIEGRQTLERHPQAVTTLAPLKSFGREQPRPLYSDQRRITPFASTMLLSQATYHAVRC